MTPLYTIAHDTDEAVGGFACRDALGGRTFDQSLVLWRFLAAVLRAMPEQPDYVQVVIDPVIAGLDRLGRGERWRSSWAAFNAGQLSWEWPAAAVAEYAAQATDKASAKKWTWPAALMAAYTATRTGVTFPHQRDILLRLIEEAGA